MRTLSREQIGKKIKTLRTRQGLTQRELANRAGLAYPTICWYEQGKHMPDLIPLHNICIVLGVDYAEILGPVD